MSETRYTDQHEWVQLDGGNATITSTLDAGPLRFVRAETRTAREVFRHVDVLSIAGNFRSGNNVIVASDAALPRSRVMAEAKRQEEPWRFMGAAALPAFVADSPVLEDDFAPVGQLIAG